MGAAMIPDSVLPTLRNACRTVQIIVLALASGVCIFAIIAVMQTKGQLIWDFPLARIENSVFLVFGVMGLIGSFLVPALITSAATDNKALAGEDRRDSLALRIAGALQTRTIVGCALLEGGAFANIMAVFQDGYGPSLVLAGVLMSMIVLRIPTWSRYLEQVEAEMRRSQEKLNG